MIYFDNELLRWRFDKISEEEAKELLSLGLSYIAGLAAIKASLYKEVIQAVGEKQQEEEEEEEEDPDVLSTIPESMFFRDS